MKRYLFRFAVSALAFCLSVSATSLWLWICTPVPLPPSPQPVYEPPSPVIEPLQEWLPSAPLETRKPGPEPKLEGIIFQTPVTSIRQGVRLYSFELFCSHARKLSYGGYQVQRVWNPETAEFSVVITKKGKRLYSEKAVSQRADDVMFGFRRLIGTKHKQLLVMIYAGGAHCCYGLLIFDLFPKFQLIFDGSEYLRLGDAMYDFWFYDVNGDGIWEFEQGDVPAEFSFFCGASLPRVPIMFAYDPGVRRYVPANHRYRKFILYGNEHLKQGILKLNHQTKEGVDPDYSADFVYVFLRYAYAGQARKAWAFFDSQYKGLHPAKQVFKKEVQEALAEDPIYQMIPQPRR
ncbi:MAG: hypothetical protein K1Y36_23575 [Blastocatellia bacterium]|nr:hypothetical protein [Blastocatellia bacterium]